MSADLIVIGRKLRNSLSRFVFGSVSDDVIDASHFPVLVVPERNRVPGSLVPEKHHG